MKSLHLLRAALALLYILIVPSALPGWQHPADEGSASAGAGEADLIYYGEIGCSHCDTFAQKGLPRAEESSGIEVTVRFVDILSKKGYEDCLSTLQARGVAFRIHPVLVIGNNVYQGNTAIEGNLLPELEYYAESGKWRPRQSEEEAAPSVEPAGESAIQSLAFIPVVLAGLVDGINPCAFATMLFFLSWLVLRGGGKKRLLVTGLSFIAGVFVSYFLTGLGLSSLFRLGSGLSLLRSLVRWGFGGLALLFALVSFVDAVRCARGRAATMSLQLPDTLKKLVHRVIRAAPSGERPLSPLVLLAFFATGVIVSLLELACTGQVYFPTIAFMAQSAPGALVPLFWLILYNTAFILPLLAILAITVFGAGIEAPRAFFMRHLAAAKVLMGCFFLALSALIVFGAGLW